MSLWAINLEEINAMTTFCLMHSSGQGPAGWKLLVDELEQRGHRALTPAFRLDKADEGLAFHTATIVEALQDSGCDPADVIIVAHSAAGMYLPLVVERWRPRQMVFLAAVVPRPGLSVREQFQSDPAMFNPAWVKQNPVDENVAREFVFHDCPPERLEWAMSTCVLFYAKRAIEEPCPLTVWPDAPASYIVCADDRTITPAWQHEVAREWLGVEPIELPGGHAPNVSRPAALADILVKLSV